MNNRLENLPVAFFASVMGLGGLSVAMHRGGNLWGPLEAGGNVVAVAAVLVFLLLLGMYGAKTVRYPGAVREELTHPVKMSFGATISVSLVLLSVALLDMTPVLSRGLWVIGSALHLVFTLYVLGSWIHQASYDIQHISPAWFIPVVGNILVPVAGVVHANPEISWFFFSIGLLFWLVLFTIIIYRMVFHNPMPDRLLPTMFILIAPPAVGFISYLRLTDELDAFARVLYYSALFLTLMQLKELPRFLRLPFFLSWWAYSFPLAAVTVATLIMAEQVEWVLLDYLSWFLMGFLVLVIGFLVLRTLLAIMRRQICVDEH